MDISVCYAAGLDLLLAHDLASGLAGVVAQQDLASIITKLTTQLKGVMMGIGVLGLSLWGIAHLAAPAIPEWALGLRGYFQKAMIVLVVVGFAPTLVSWLYNLGA